MVASDWEDDGTNGAGHPCVDRMARRAAGHALTEAQRVGDGLVEVHGLISGVENRLTEKIAIGFELLGLANIRGRYRETDRMRPQEPLSLPPMREKTMSELERLAEAAAKATEGLERLSSPDIIHESRTPSDPVESAKNAAKKVTFGVFYIWRDVALDFVKDHWKELLLAALATGHLPWLIAVLAKLPPFVQHLLQP